MSEIFLVRHAQASFGADNYDQLSPLGIQQSQWLGEHFHDRGIRFDRVIAGSLSRQQDTATAILAMSDTKTPLEIQPGLNEFDFHALAAAFCRKTNTPPPSRADGPRPFFQLLRLAMLAWSKDELTPHERESDDTILETWQQFHDRVAAVFQLITSSAKTEKVLVVSSGGAIAMAMSQILQCNVESLINLNMQIKNTGVTQLFYKGEILLISSFNNAPHLERRDRSHALTWA